MEERQLVAKAKIEEPITDNEDLLKKISNVMNKVSKTEKLRAKAKEKTKAITERKDRLEKEVMELKKALAEKDVTLQGYEAADDTKIQEAYYQGQHDCIVFVKPKVQQNLQVYFSRGWFATLDKLQVEVSSSLSQESNIPILEELIIIPNPEIQAIINGESPICKVERDGPIAGSGGELTSSVAMSTTEELPCA